MNKKKLRKRIRELERERPGRVIFPAGTVGLTGPIVVEGRAVVQGPVSTKYVSGWSLPQETFQVLPEVSDD